MSSDQTPDTPATPDPDTGGSPPPPPEDDPTIVDFWNEPDREAKIRKQRNEERAASKALRERVDEFERAEVMRLAGDRLAKPDDLFLAASLDDMRDEGGRLSVEKAEQAIEATLKERPHWKRATLPDLHQGVRRGAPEPPSIGQAIKNAVRGGR